ncbi:hypothetical protein BVX97_00585 [bacterium E08(2017)]|nr:hypothetical protein BVX97_00585 [bacterium E08(2017)]
MDISSLSMYSTSSAQGDQTDGTFNGVKIYFCHTSRSTLSNTFTDNYDGNTPTLMLDRSSFTMNWTASAWNAIALDNTFLFNGSDNLLIEIQWTSSADSLLAGASSLAGNCMLGTIGSSTGSEYYRAVFQLHYTAPSEPFFSVTQTDVSCVDGLVDPGETIDVTCYVTNFGTTATSAQATLSTTSAYCSVTQPNWSMGTVNQSNSVDNSATPFTVDISPAAPIGANLPFDLTITANGGAFTQRLDVTVSVAEPVFALEAFLVNDFSGNTNLALNPEELAFITVVLTNAGAYASNVTASLSCSDTSISLASGSCVMDDVPKYSTGDNMDTPFCVQVASNAWESGLYNFTLGLSYNDGMSNSLTFQVAADYGDPVVSSSSWLSTVGGTDYSAAMVADGYDWIDLPFDFPFYGSEYRTGVLLVKHGYIVLGDPWLLYSSNFPIPRTGEINRYIAPYFDTLDMSTGLVRSKLYGSAPNRIFVVSWNGLVRASDPGSSVTFQMLLHESGKIQFQYGTCDGGTAPNGASATIGIENTDGTSGVQHSYNQANAITNGTCLTFERTKPPVDSDADGMPDDAEMMYWGDLSQTANSDDDMDGLSNIEELNAATDPGERENVLEVENTSVELSTNIVINWKSIPGQLYNIWTCDDLSSGWSNLNVAPFVGSSSGYNQCTVSVDDAESSRFFKISID